MSLLPLPLTVFEEFMLAEDRSGYPCQFFMHLRFLGNVDREIFESSVRTATERHPLLCARIQRARTPRWIWDKAELGSDIHWRQISASPSLPTAEYIDLEKRNGFMVHVASDANRADVTFQFHHSTCDGLGAFRVIEDVLIAYALGRQEGCVGVKLPEIKFPKLARRGSMGFTWKELAKTAPKQLVGLLGVRQFLSHKPVPLIPQTPRKSQAAPPSTFPATRFLNLHETTSMALRSVANQAKVTVNEILLRDFLVAIDTCRSRWQVGTSTDWLRIMVPMSLRRKVHRGIPAANIVSSIFLDRQREQIVADSLLRSIHDEMEVIKRNDLRFTLLLSLAAQRWIPGGLPAASAGETCKVSSVLTNLGKLLTETSLPQQNNKLVVGNLLLDEVQVYAPIRPHLNASFAVSNYANRLGIGMHFDPDALTDLQADELLREFGSRIEKSSS